MLYLLVGDCHIRLQDLEEGTRLVDFIEKTATSNKVDVIWFAGDQFHYFNITHNTVTDFWYKTFKRLSKIFRVIVTVGNHEMERGLTVHSLQLFKNKFDNLHIVDEPWVFDNKLFLPYIDDNKEFVGICNKYKEIPIVMAHAEVNGADYDNGFKITTGIDLSDIPQKLVVSGHIHKYSEMDRLIYIGSPRWITLGDANISKFIWVSDLENRFTPILTNEVCKPIYKYEDHEEEPLIMGKNPDTNTTVDIYGSKSFVEKRDRHWKELGYKTRHYLIKINTSKVKESMGVISAFCAFIEEFKPVYGTSITRLKELSTKRLQWIN